MAKSPSPGSSKARARMVRRMSKLVRLGSTENLRVSSAPERGLTRRATTRTASQSYSNTETPEDIFFDFVLVPLFPVKKSISLLVLKL